VADIDAANPVVASEPLKIGQQLIIPSKIESKVNSLAVIAHNQVKGNKPNTTEKTLPLRVSQLFRMLVVDTDNRSCSYKQRNEIRNCQRIWHFSGGVRKAKS
jgi:hypothetical protein